MSKLMRAHAITAVTVVAALLIGALVPGTPVSAHAAGLRLTGFGTAVVDGVLSPGEWDAAARYVFSASLPPSDGGGTTPATLLVMNDDVNLYLAVRLSRPQLNRGDLGFGLDQVVFEFDNDHSGGAPAEGDDILLLSPGINILGVSTFFDEVRTTRAPCPPGIGLCGFLDVQLDEPGTNDGAGAATNNGTFSFFEMSHPLHGADALNDFNLSAGSTAGFNLQVNLSSLSAFCASDCSASTAVPPFERGDIVIASPDPLARKLNLAFVDPAGDNTGPIDVTRMWMAFDTGTGAYEIVLTATPEAPFGGQFRVNVNLWNPTASSLFSTALNDFDMSTGVTVIRLTGTSSALLSWQVGDVVATNTLAGFGNPPGVTLFRTSVASRPFGFLTNEDPVAYGQAGSTLIQRFDLTPPTITVSGNAGSYAVDETISINCEATDDLSGVATTSCPAVASGPATNYVGTTQTTTTTRTATATDYAGNTASAEATFSVTVTAGGICRLAASLSNATAVCAQLQAIAAAPEGVARSGRLDGFDQFLNAQSGRSIEPSFAALLSRLAHLL